MTSASTNGRCSATAGIIPRRPPTSTRSRMPGSSSTTCGRCRHARTAAPRFSGRYPFRTHVYTAIGSNDLANYMVNHNEVTIPKLLRQKGYKSAMFGKFHLGTQGNNPYGLSMVTALGWDYYDGWLDETGDPSSIDSTAGGVADPGTWTCGFVRDATNPGGADTGACYAAGNTCQMNHQNWSRGAGTHLPRWRRHLRSEQVMRQPRPRLHQLRHPERALRLAPGD